MDYHEKRCLLSRQKLFGHTTDSWRLTDFIELPEYLDNGIYKCRIVYAHTVQSVSFVPYAISNIARIKIIHDDEVSYDKKYLQRPHLDDLFTKKENADEIIIIKNNYVTDAYYYNIIFEKADKLYTSDTPLLLGTKRQYLIDQKLVNVIPIHYNDIFTFDRIHLINALVDIGEITLQIDAIF